MEAVWLYIDEKTPARDGSHIGRSRDNPNQCLKEHDGEVSPGIPRSWQQR